MRTTPPPRSQPRRSRGQEGVAIIMTALLLIPLMVFAAYGVDLASWYSRISYLQKSADAAALAGTVWMPDIAEARKVACQSLQRNGLGDGSATCHLTVYPNLDIEIEYGSSDNSLKVTVTEPNATRYFSQVIGHTQSLSRSAEAEYNLPIPLGSPLNYFGGNASKNTYTRIDTPASNTVTWPPNWNNVANPPTNAPCNVSNTVSLGRWTSATAFDGAAANSGSTQCRWTVNGDPTTPTPVSVPPPDYYRRAPTNTPCNVFGVSPGTNGRWETATTYNAGAKYTSGTGNRQCTWDARITRASSVQAFMRTTAPVTRPCNVGYQAADGSWPSSGAWATGMLPTGSTVKTAANGNQLCEWTAQITSIPASSSWVPTGNQIDATRSPGFWAMAEGPGTVNPNGDAFSPRCYITVNCTETPPNTPNKNYRSDVNRGFWYVVKIPSGLSGNVAIQVYDAQFGGNAVAATLPANCSQSGTSQVDCVSGLSNMTGDEELNSSGNSFQTEYRVFKQTNPFDFEIRTNVFTGSSGDTSENSCWWGLREEPFFRLQWRTLCTLTGVQSGDLYLVNVRTNDTQTNGSGVNAYAVQACANGSCTTGVQPALYAYRDMGMFNNFTASGGTQTATFYLAEVGPQYAGKTLVVDLWDPGDSSGQSTIYPMKPSTNPAVPGPVVNVAATDCSYTASPAPNAPQTTSAGGATGRQEATAHASDTSPSCGIITHNGSSSQFNGEWLKIRINVPSGYTCTVGINPVTTGNSCWWGIQYQFAAATTDVTTWAARIEGNPVHLTR